MAYDSERFNKIQAQTDEAVRTFFRSDDAKDFCKARFDENLKNVDLPDSFRKKIISSISELPDDLRQKITTVVQDTMATHIAAMNAMADKVEKDKKKSVHLRRYVIIAVLTCLTTITDMGSRVFSQSPAQTVEEVKNSLRDQLKQELRRELRLHKESKDATGGSDRPNG